jgi:hypothetical protein
MMTEGKQRRIARNVLRKPTPKNGTQYRNRISQAAAKYHTSERRVHAAMFSTNPTRRTLNA